MLKRLAGLFFKVPDHKKNFFRTSYSQCGEDIIIDFLFNELGINQPDFIDIGAHHPQYINNTYLFYLKGSRGINIEPDPSLIQAFNRVRKNDINLNIGIGDTNSEVDFYIMNEPTLNTFMKEEAERIEKEKSFYKIVDVKKVRISPLEEIINTHCAGKFPDLLSIDVEGLDEQILKSIDYNRSAPKVMCVETLTFSTIGKGEKKVSLIEFVKNNGYMVYADTYINTIFVRNDIFPRSPGN